MTTPNTESIGRSSLRFGFILITFAFACFGLLPIVQAVSPPPDGFYPKFTTAEGQNALFSLTTGVANTAVGWFSLKSDTDGSFNTGVGAGTLVLNTADQNTAVGAAALLLNTTGLSNTAVGATALLNNVDGDDNTAIGEGALHGNTSGTENTATGVSALFSNTIGTFNTATGVAALARNDTGDGNTANGFLTLSFNTTGFDNTADGTEALHSNIDGDSNTAIGSAALSSTTHGSSNTAIGIVALSNNTTGDNNIAMGGFAGVSLTTGSNNIDIGNFGVADESNTIRIGVAGTQTATFVAGISGTAVVGDPVLVDANGQLGTATSSARFKKDIKPMKKASESILALKPVTFRYKHEIDPNGIPQFGLVAEEVEKVNPDLVSRDRDGKPYTVRYEAVNAMLLNEFLKEHRKVEDQDCRLQQQEATIAQQQKEFASKIALQQKQIEALTAGLQKVSTQVEMSKAAPEMVLNNQ